MHFRANLTRNSSKTKTHAKPSLQKLTFLQFQPHDSPQFKILPEDNCYDLTSQQTLRQTKKTKFKLPPIQLHIQKSTLQNPISLETPEFELKKKEEYELTSMIQYTINKTEAPIKSNKN